MIFDAGENYLNKIIFSEKIEFLKSKFPGSSHWDESRWAYHAFASLTAQMLRPKSVLELGTMGVKICSHSDEMDFPVADFWPVENPRFLHNAKVTPWPISDKAYDLFIALRVFHHLVPEQRKCFLEMKRIAKNIILTLPISYDHDSASRAVGMETLVSYNSGRYPTATVETEKEVFYFWSEKDL